MFSPNKNNSPLGSSFEQPVYQHQRNIRNIESHYFRLLYDNAVMNTKSLFRIKWERLKRRRIGRDRNWNCTTERMKNISMK